jgi:hypothetical protein
MHLHSLHIRSSLQWACHAAMTSWSPQAASVPQHQVQLPYNIALDNL